MSDNWQFQLRYSSQMILKSITQFIENSSYLDKIVKIAESMTETFKKDRKIMACGNGGSACQAMHFAEELTGRYRNDRKALPALSLTDAAHMSCVANDYGFESVFSRAIEAYAKPNDSLLVLSTSGNSKNLINAVNTAKKKCVTTYALLGKEGGYLAGMSDYEIIVPGSNSDEIQNIHMIIIHLLIEAVERQLFLEDYPSIPNSNLVTTQKSA